MADVVRTQGADPGRRGQDPRPREEGGELTDAVLQRSVGQRLGVPWSEFAGQAPQLAEFGARRLAVVPAYLATVDEPGAPRVHPVTPIIGGGRLFLFMEPTSPKGDNIVRRRVYALHCLVPDAHGTGGEFYIRGRGQRIDTPHLRAVAAQAAS